MSEKKNLENYQRVKKVKDEDQKISQNEIRITSAGRPRGYITYASALLTGENVSDEKEDQVKKEDLKKYDSVTLKGMGRAINKAVSIAEIIKRRVAGLYQTTEINSTNIVDEWEPKDKESKLENIKTNRTVSSIVIVLSTKQLNKSHLGYQDPIDESEVEAFVKFTKKDDKKEKKEKKVVEKK